MNRITRIFAALAADVEKWRGVVGRAKIEKQ
jgi:hypothetical protein